MSVLRWSRFYALLRLELVAARSEWLLPLGLPPALWLLGSLFSIGSARGTNDWPELSFQIGLIFALGSTVQAHRRELEPTTAPLYLLLPASHLERFLSKLVLSIGLPFFAQALCLTLLVNLMALTHLIPGSGAAVWPDFSMLRTSLGYYLLLHAPMFCGGIFFRSLPLPKTLLSIVAYSGAFSLLFVLVALNRTGVSQDATMALIALITQMGQAVAQAKNAALVFGFGLLPGLLYAAAYFRAVENELRS